MPKQLESCSITLSVIVPQRSRSLPLLTEVVYGKVTLGKRYMYLFDNLFSAIPSDQSLALTVTFETPVGIAGK